MLNDNTNPRLEIYGQVRFIFRKRPLKDISSIILISNTWINFSTFKNFHRHWKFISISS